VVYATVTWPGVGAGLGVGVGVAGVAVGVTAGVDDPPPPHPLIASAARATATKPSFCIELLLQTSYRLTKPPTGVEKRSLSCSRIERARSNQTFVEVSPLPAEVRERTPA
jgi:hypothetical protein